MDIKLVVLDSLNPNNAGNKLCRRIIILLLPLWKFAAKHLIVKAIRELEDFIPELVAFTVDFFSALFVSACMTTSGSIYLSVMFIVGDVGQSLLEFNEVRANAVTLLQLLRSRRESQARSPKRKSQSAERSEDIDLVAMILYVARNPGSFHEASMRPARLFACLPHSLPAHEQKQLEALEASGAYGIDERISSRWIHHKQHQLQVYSIAVVPVSYSLVVSFPPGSEFAGKDTISTIKASSNKVKNAERSKELVLQGLQLLFHCEYLALVEYVECVVPLVFVTYKSILEQLSNVVFYPGGAGNWGTSAVTNLLVFAALEIGTFVLFVQFLQRKFKV
ncbi:unnamed protein product [Phytophthora fragariaefolia]|uniref:Unnamed protein product n=1 Tax=Phytophthora fragariaefolia TaxID=1490495 RepID=A0A9W6U1H7_9STRA|nr:unnamed protein product [Phytophthora fragariaefolia]